MTSLDWIAIILCIIFGAVLALGYIRMLRSWAFEVNSEAERIIRKYFNDEKVEVEE